MINEVTLSVSFPVFGNNYYSQPFESRKVLTLVFDKKFEALLIPAAANHFNNEWSGSTISSGS
jgi:diphthamide synthase (EF-2-diphthine--ammonia ligase)